MPKKILLIESEQSFAARLSGSLQAAGFEVRTTGDGKEGLELARDLSPDAIVLCVELASMSGYLVCQRLKKDETLKAIPLVLTSAEATQETFEKHRTLKARADEYVLKPYEPEALLETLGALVGLPDRAASGVADEEEELVTLEEESTLDVAADELADGPDVSAEENGPGGLHVDEDLRLLDDAFDDLSAPLPAREAAAALDELTGDAPVAIDDLDAAAASLPEEDDERARADLSRLDEDAESALGSLGDDGQIRSAGIDIDDALPTRRRPSRSATRPDLLRAASVDLVDEAHSTRSAMPAPALFGDPALGGTSEAGMLKSDLEEARAALERSKQDASARDSELRDLRRKLDAISRRAEDMEGELSAAKSRAEEAQERARKAEADLQASRAETRKAEELVGSLENEVTDMQREAKEAEARAANAEKRTAQAEHSARRKVEEASSSASRLAEALARAESLERETGGLRTELLIARGEADGAREEIDRRTSEANKRIAELETAGAKNEERVVKAYQKIKADEKVRDKVRKALTIALQLLEEGIPVEPAPVEKERRTAAAARD